MRHALLSFFSVSTKISQRYETLISGTGGAATCDFPSKCNVMTNRNCEPVRAIGTLQSSSVVGAQDHVTRQSHDTEFIEHAFGRGVVEMLGLEPNHFKVL